MASPDQKLIIEKLDIAGKRLAVAIDQFINNDQSAYYKLLELTLRLSHENSFFTEKELFNALRTIVRNLDKVVLEHHFGHYSQPTANGSEKILSLIPSNNPLGGFTDLVRALIFRKPVIFRLPKENKKFLPALVQFMKEYIPDIDGFVSFTEEMIPRPDVLFTYELEKTNSEQRKYFSRYDGVVRDRIKSAAVLDGNETQKQLTNLAHGVLAYFGQNRHNVSKLFVPEEYDFEKLMPGFKEYKHLFDHNTYRNNYDYYKSIYLINKDPHFDNGYLLFREEQYQTINPLSVIFFEKYNDSNELKEKIERNDFLKVYRVSNLLNRQEMLFPDLFSLENNALFLKALKVI